MKVAGFTFIRNALKYDYPIREAIQSILPLCDYVVVAVGKSDDDTLDLIRSIDSNKIRVLETVWDDTVREGGRVLAVETDKAYQAISEDADWCIYIQGDEVLHEGSYPEIQKNMKKYLSDERVEGFLCKYRHFYGSYDYIGDSRRWYRREVRILRKHPDIHSYRDAQGFRKNGNKLRVILLDAWIHHYGWVKHPQAQQQKQLNFNKWWHDDDWVRQNVEPLDEFDYSNIDILKRFEGKHPAVMQERIQKVNWTFSFDPTKRQGSLKDRFLKWIEDRTNIRLGEYKNYVLIQDA
jgi:hypothetical protein